MSTSLTSINGIYRKVIANNEARLKYTYVAGITNPATKSLALFSIPFADAVQNDAVQNTSMFGLVSSTDDAEQIRKDINGTQYETNLRFDSLDKMMSRPNTTEFAEGQFINEGLFNATRVAINDDIFFSVLFEVDIEGFEDDIYIVCHKDGNDIPVSAIQISDSSVVSLGNNLYVTKLNSSFTIKNNNDGQALDNFPLPYFTIAHIEDGVYRRLNIDFKIHDIAICACLNQS